MYVFLCQQHVLRAWHGTFWKIQHLLYPLTLQERIQSRAAATNLPHCRSKFSHVLLYAQTGTVPGLTGSALEAARSTRCMTHVWTVR